MSSTASREPFPFVGKWLLIDIPQREPQDQLIYREARLCIRAKSVALRRESDWDTGLSFSKNIPMGRSYLVYRTLILKGFGFTVDEDGGQIIIGRQTGTPFLRGGHTAVYGYDHVSAYRQDEIWNDWYEAEKTNSGSPDVSSYSEAFFLAHVQNKCEERIIDEMKAGEMTFWLTANSWMAT